MSLVFIDLEWFLILPNHLIKTFIGIRLKKTLNKNSKNDNDILGLHHFMNNVQKKESSIKKKIV